jgi:DNA-binding SARP family transcriptional activator
LIAVTSRKEKATYKINIHAIHYPPLNGLEIHQPLEGKTMQASAYALVIVLGSILFVIVYLILKREKQNAGLRGKRNEERHRPPVQLKKENSHLLNADIINSLPDREVVVSTIYLFGGFQVFDRNGVDITSKFPTIVRELFALLLLYSHKQERGISTTLLCEHFWPDKNDVSARNNRNVNLTKLRALLEEVGDIKIENKNSYHRLVLGKGVFCDYYIVSKILSNPGALSEEMTDLLLKCANRGSLLPHLQPSWLDNFKSDISNKIIDVLLAYSQKLDFNQHDKTLIEIADTIFYHDSVNQEALVIKCSVLNRRGRYSLAKTWYDHFAKEYKHLYSQNYPRTFDQVIT